MSMAGFKNFTADGRSAASFNKRIARVLVLPLSVIASYTAQQQNSVMTACATLEVEALKLRMHPGMQVEHGAMYTSPFQQSQPVQTNPTFYWSAEQQIVPQQEVTAYAKQGQDGLVKFVQMQNGNQADFLEHTRQTRAEFARQLQQRNQQMMALSQAQASQLAVAAGKSSSDTNMRHLQSQLQMSNDSAKASENKMTIFQQAMQTYLANQDGQRNFQLDAQTNAALQNMGQNQKDILSQAENGQSQFAQAASTSEQELQKDLIKILFPQQQVVQQPAEAETSEVTSESEGSDVDESASATSTESAEAEAAEPVPVPASGNQEPQNPPPQPNRSTSRGAKFMRGMSRAFSGFKGAGAKKTAGN